MRKFRRSPLLLVLPLLVSLLIDSACSPMTEQASEPVDSGTAAAVPTGMSSIPLPGGEGGIGFDDLRYSARLGRVLVPGGRTGKLYLVDPASGAVQSVEGFSAKAGFAGGHGDGTTSVDDGDGLLFAIDRTSRTLLVLDAELHVASQVALTGGPDYVRWVGPTREVWVTEPGAEAIEVFSPGADARHAPERLAVIAVPGGPESLVIDAIRGRAWTHTWEGETIGLDLRTRAEVARFSNGCKGSRGIALDEARGLLFVGCAEGGATVLDLAHDGRQLGSATTGAGVDIIDYDPSLGHLYVPGGDAGTLTVLGVGADGAMTRLGSISAAEGCHSVVTDGAGRVFVGDPDDGRLLVFHDTFATSLPGAR